MSYNNICKEEINMPYTPINYFKKSELLKLSNKELLNHYTKALTYYKREKNIDKVSKYVNLIFSMIMERMERN